MPESLSRRTLLKAGGSLWATAAISGQFAAIARAAADNRSAKKMAVLTAAEASCAEAVAARILPTTDTPGAREAGAVWFIDAALAGDSADDLPVVRRGLAELDAAAGGNFSRLGEDAQDEILRAREDSPFFGAMHFLTVAGTFTLSQYGGNAGNVGWKIIGLSDQHHWQPPFGYYDAPVHNALAAGEKDTHGEHKS
jgi:hypothetical protein